MANSERKIIRGVRVGGKTHTSGMEDELNAVLSAEDATRLVSNGYLSGKWDGKARETKARETVKEK